MIKSEITLVNDASVSAEIHELKIEGDGKEIHIKNMCGYWEGILQDLLCTGHLVEFIKEHKEELKEYFL